MNKWGAYRMGWIFVLLSWLGESGFALPANDSFANRIPLAGTTVTVEGNTESATTESGESAGIPYEIRYTVWYSWTSPSDGLVRLIGSNPNPSGFRMTVLAYRGVALSNLTPITPDDLGRIRVSAGDTLQIQIGSAYDGWWGAYPGPFTLALQLEPLPPATMVMDQWQGASDSVARFSVGAQTFTPAVSGQLYQVVIGGCFNSPVPISVSVVELVNGLPGPVVLGRSVADHLTCAMQEFTFPGQSVYLEAERAYGLVVATDDPLDSGNSTLRTSMFNNYLRGALFQKVPGGSWEHAYLFEGPNDSMDLVFATYMVPGTPPVRITAPEAHSTYRVGDTISLLAAVGADVTPPVTVSFLSAGALLGSSAQAPYTIAWTPSQAGVFELAATAAGQNALTFTSKVVSVTVKIPGPVNDDFAARTVLPGDYAIAGFSTVNASLEFGEPRPFPNSAGGTVWWSWTAPRSGFVTVEVLEPHRLNATLGLFMGSSLDMLTPVTNGAGRCAFLAAAGQRFSIVVDASAGTLDGANLAVAQSDLEVSQPAPKSSFTAPASVTIAPTRTGTSRVLGRVEFYSNDTLVGASTSEPYTVTTIISDPGYYKIGVRAYDVSGVATDSTPVPIVVHPQNDDYENAASISGNIVAIQTSNLSATLQSGEPTYADNEGGHSVWYKWTAPNDGFCSIDGSGYGFDLLLAAYVGTSVGSLSQVAQNAFSPGGPITFYAFGGTTYYLGIDGLFGEEGHLTFNLRLRPTNDYFTTPTLIDGANYEVIASTRGASVAPGEGNSPLCRAAELINVPSLAARILTHSDPVSLLLWAESTWRERNVLIYNGSLDQQINTLLSMFNRAIGRGFSIYDPIRFSGVTISAATAELLAEQPQGDRLSLLNRLLLQDAYPLELAMLRAVASEAPLDASSSLWWTWKASLSGPVTLTAVSTSTETQLAAFTGASQDSLVQVASTAAWSVNSTLTFNAQEGTTHQIAVFGHLSQPADITFSLRGTGIRLLNPLDGSVIASPASLQLRVQVDNSGTAISAVEFYANNMLLGAAQPPYHLNWDNISPGTYTLTARSMACQQTLSSSAAVTILVSESSAPDLPRVFSGVFANCSYVLNALGELRVFGAVGSQFDLPSADDLAYPQLASCPGGMQKWRIIEGGEPSWALTFTGELYQSGCGRVSFPPGVSRWLDVAAGVGGALTVGDDGRVYSNGNVLVEYAAQGIPWREAGITYSCVITLSRDGEAYVHAGDVYGHPASASIPFPAGVGRWLRMTTSIRGTILQGTDMELYWYYHPPSLAGPIQPAVKIIRPAAVSAWSEFTVGGFHMLLLGNNGQIYSSGRNWEGQLGNGAGGNDVGSLVEVLLPPGVTAWKAIAAGYKHSLAIGDDCNLYAWGDNSYGQLGIGFNAGQNRPLPTANLRALCGVPVVFAEGQAVPLDDGSVRVQFKSDLNRSYLVQYTEDLAEWKTSFPALTGTGGTLEWIDDGPPKTDAHPTTQSRRLYRLVYAH